MPTHSPRPFTLCLALSSRKPLEKPRQLYLDRVPPPPHFPNTCASLPKGHSPGWGHLGWSPEKNPEQYPGDAGTDEPDPVCGGLTFTCLGSPLPPGPAPSAPHAGPRFFVHRRVSRLPGGHGQQEEPSSAPAMRRHQEHVQLQMMEKREWGQKKIDPGRGRETQGIVFKEDSHKESDHCSWRKKRAWEIHAVCTIGDQKQFLSSSLWEGDPAGAKKDFQEHKCEGETQGPHFSPVPGAALPGLTQQPRARRMGRRRVATPGTTLGKSNPAAAGPTEEFFCLGRIF